MASLAPRTDPFPDPTEPEVRGTRGDGILLGAIIALVLAVAVLGLAFLVIYATFVSLAA